MSTAQNEDIASPHAVIGNAANPAQRVLIVDDNRDAADSMSMLLQQFGMEVQVCYNGAEALAMFSGYRPAVVLLDIGMPGMDGYAVAGKLRQLETGAGALFIALTGWGQEQDRRRSLASGFNHHLTKPADMDLLWSLLRDATSKAGAKGPPSGMHGLHAGS